jgi:hypothetical protein
MFPGCTELQMRVRNQDVLREAGFQPRSRAEGAVWPKERKVRLGRALVQYVSALLAVIGL